MIEKDAAEEPLEKVLDGACPSRMAVRLRVSPPARAATERWDLPEASLCARSARAMSWCVGMGEI